jgi:diacylglycerol O-acyltransferase / wax synthase
MELDVQQLSWTDDMMLRAERPETPMQIQMLLIYDPSTAPGGRVTFKGILEEIDARLHLAPTFRRRLTELPGGLHMPYWVDDPNFDLEYHVRHIALPQPGAATGVSCASRSRAFTRDRSTFAAHRGR